MEENREKLLSVQNLEQHFKSGGYTIKAVDGISFDIYKGEVFGLVGESGCGKTTTGRSIIRLYDITSGSVYFKGQRICAGVRSYKQAIKDARKKYDTESVAIIAEYDEKIKQLGADEKDLATMQSLYQRQGIKHDAKMDIADEAGNKLDELNEQKNALLQECSDKLAELKRVCAEEIDKQQNEIAKARFDHKNCNKEYAKKQVALVDEKYQPLIAAAQTEQEQQEIKKEYQDQIRLAKKDRIMNKMQMIFQDPIASLNPRMTVREIIAEGLLIRGIRDKKAIDEAVYKVLDLVGLVPEHAGRYPHEFSGGQRQRIGIARAIVLNPELIIADEPISALDVSIQAQVINLLNDLRRDLGLTILFIAHDLSVVKYFSDRIAVMYFGHIVELTTSDELFRHPLHPYTKSLLSAIPLPDPHTEKTRKRIVYNPLAQHDYTKQAPTIREIIPGHFVSCNDEEEQRYLEEIKMIDSKQD